MLRLLLTNEDELLPLLRSELVEKSSKKSLIYTRQAVSIWA